MSAPDHGGPTDTGSPGAKRLLSPYSVRTEGES